MRRGATALLFMIAMAGPSVAQTPGPGAGPAQPEPPMAAPMGAAPEDDMPPPAGSGPPGAPAGQADARKQIIDACRSQAKSQGLKGPDRKTAVIACVAKQRPGLAHRMQCRQDGRAKGISGDSLKAFVKSCAQGKA